ncbi:MAG: IS481 family transposase, partial [candidate division Zixibacteria bacterium]|nr:IS481 family transposase [candidate division Zixibacteria bacterium]
SGCSRQHFYDIKTAYESQGLEGLKEKTRRKPCIKNRVAPEIEQAVLQMALEYPAYGQMRASNELRKQGVLISSGGIRSIWLRHDLEVFKKRLKALEEKAAKEGLVYTEEQLRVLESARRERETVPNEIETHHPGYLLAQDTFYVGYIKGVGRIYQQTVIDTYSAVAFAKLYTAKVPLTAADTLNDRVVPFFEEQRADILRILTDRGTEYCGRLDKHPYQLYLQLHEIEHTRTKARHPQTNGICERFHKTVLNEFYRSIFRKKIFSNTVDLQTELDSWMESYNRERTHQGKRCQGRTPMATFIDGLELARKAKLTTEEKPAA